MTTQANKDIECQPNEERLWRVKDVALYLACSDSYVYKAAERGDLPHVTIGPMLRFIPVEVRAHAMQARAARMQREAKSKVRQH